VRIVVDTLLRFGNVDQTKHVNGLRQCLFGRETFVQTQRFGNLLTHAQHGVEGGHGFLEDHGNFFGTQTAHGLRVGLHQVLPFKPNLAIGNAARRHGQQLHDGHGCDAFAAT